MKDARGHGSNQRGVAAHQTGVENAGMVPLYRGESVGNKGGNFYTPDREWARQFTQSGQDKEILEASVDSRHIHDASDIYAGDEAGFDRAIATARTAGKKAVRFNEGVGEPHSVYVFDKSALRRVS